MVTMIASQTSVRGTGSRRVCVLGAWTLCREDGIAIQRAEDGQSRCEYSARARDERSSKEKLSPPTALFASSSPPTSSASLAQHLRHAPLGTSAGSSIIDADLCPTHHRGPSIASVQCQPP